LKSAAKNKTVKSGGEIKGKMIKYKLKRISNCAGYKPPHRGAALTTKLEDL
jgi:hypothetical protein